MGGSQAPTPAARPAHPDRGGMAAEWDSPWPQAILPETAPKAQAHRVQVSTNS